MPDNSTVIVALPTEDDYVHKISSENKPHLTLMYLGENLDMDHFEEVVRYVQHVAETSMERFGLSVDRRGTLGPKDADVLFFEDGWQTKEIKQIQGYLRADEHISNAYHQSKQYAKWTPHLTLGYPETPAKPDEREYPGLHYVSFDRIAIWNGDYEGPEFRIKRHEYSDELAMSLAKADGALFVDSFFNGDVEDYVKHYGVPGMQWGKRKASDSGSGSAPSAPKERGFLRRGLTKTGTALSAGQSVVDKGNDKLIFLPQEKRNQIANGTKNAALGAAISINRSPQFKGKDLNADPKLKQAYHDQVKNAAAKVYKEELAKARVEFAADLIEAAVDARRQRVAMRAPQSAIKHADTEMGTLLELSFEEDDLGQIKSFDTINEDVKHFDLDEDILIHYGVPGMQWGKRKTRTPSGVEVTSTPGKRVKASGGKNEAPSEDAKRTAIQKQIAKRSSTDALSNNELKQLVERMNLEANYERLAKQSSGNDIVKKLFSEPKYRNQQIEGLQKLSMPLKIGAGAAAAIVGTRAAIGRTDLSNLTDD